MATREPKERRPHIWTVRVFIALLIVVPAAPWYLLGFEKHYNSAQEDYDTIESMGFPLDQESFFQHYRVPADQNNGERLAKALQLFESKVSELDSRLAKSGKAMRFPLIELTGITYLSVKPGQTRPTDNERLAAFDLVRPYVNEIEASAQKPFYAPTRLISRSEESYDPTLGTNYKIVRLICDEAKLLAKQGRRADAIERLSFAVRLTNITFSYPQYSRITYGMGQISRIGDATLQCAKSDPGSASDYLKVRTQFSLPPTYVGVNSELVRIMDFYRNNSSSLLINEILSGRPGTHLQENTVEMTPTTQLPDNKLMRAWAGFTLKQWLPIMQELNRDGSAKNAQRMAAARSEYWQTAAKFRGLISVGHRRIHDILIDSVGTIESGKRRLALHFGAIRVIDYKHRHGNWPKTLAEAGVEPIEPGGSVQADFGYQVTSGSVWMWVNSEIGPTPNFARGEGSDLVDLARKTSSRP